MQPGIPSASDFLTLCRSSNQQLAADKLNSMLNKVRKFDMFVWGIGTINERDDNLPHNDDYFGTPLSLAAKYGNTDICKILIEKIKHQQLSLPTKIRIYLSDRILTTQYKDYIQSEEEEYLYNAFKKAIKYNNFKTADYIYTVYETKIDEKILITETLIEELENVNNTEQLAFLLQKIALSSMWTDCLPYYLVDLAKSSAEKNNWELVSYIITKHIDLIKKSSNISIQRFLYETIKNKKFDIALEVIKNTSTHYIFNTKESFIIYDVLADNTLLELINKNCDAETIEWLNNIINSN
jgi:hypothetical protein